MVQKAEGIHPVSRISKVINVTAVAAPAAENPAIYATLMLWKKSGQRWTDEELMPVKKIEIAKDGKSVKLVMNDGATHLVEY